ncbi:hypothetical protein D3C72_2253890 [compost metagenome]
MHEPETVEHWHLVGFLLFRRWSHPGLHEALHGVVKMFMVECCVVQRTKRVLELVFDVLGYVIALPSHCTPRFNAFQISPAQFVVPPTRV